MNVVKELTISKAQQFIIQYTYIFSLVQRNSVLEKYDNKIFLKKSAKGKNPFDVKTV